MNNEYLYVRVLTPKSILYEGEALSISSTNSQGKFDVLPQHANFISFIENQPIEIRKKDHKLISFGFSKAIIYTLGNKVSIYAEPHST